MKPLLLTSTSEELYAPRNSRYEVAKQIFDDLDYAIQYLPDELAYDGKISKQGAQAFKARTLLFASEVEVSPFVMTGTPPKRCNNQKY